MPVWGHQEGVSGLMRLGLGREREQGVEGLAQAGETEGEKGLLLPPATVGSRRENKAGASGGVSFQNTAQAASSGRPCVWLGGGAEAQAPTPCGSAPTLPAAGVLRPELRPRRREEGEETPLVPVGGGELVRS